MERQVDGVPLPDVVGGAGRRVLGRPVRQVDPVREQALLDRLPIDKASPGGSE